MVFIHTHTHVRMHARKNMVSIMFISPLRIVLRIMGAIKTLMYSRGKVVMLYNQSRYLELFFC